MLKIIILLWALWTLAFSASSTMVAIKDQDLALMLMSAPAVGFNLVVVILLFTWLAL